MNAAERFAAWMSGNRHVDRRYGHVYRYHPRSDAHSVALCNYIKDDLLERCPALREQALQGRVAYGINVRYVWPSTGKAKTLDLALGRPASPVGNVSERMARTDEFSEVFISCEAKSVMTEHGKSQPRVYDELGSSHEIVHQGRQEAIAAGIAVVNIAPSFVSPLRQTTADRLFSSQHNQPLVARRMIEHLRGLPIRQQIGDVGFDAYCSLVVACDNQSDCTLWIAPPAPQSGDKDHYDTFIDRIARFYTERFSSLS